MTEAELQEAVRQLATLLGWLTYHTYDSRRSNAGFPDLVLAHPERGVIFAELKSTKGKVTPEQREWCQTLANGGCEVWILYPDGIDAFATRLGRK